MTDPLRAVVEAARRFARVCERSDRISRTSRDTTRGSAMWEEHMAALEEIRQTVRALDATPPEPLPLAVKRIAQLASERDNAADDLLEAADQRGNRGQRDRLRALAAEHRETARQCREAIERLRHG